MKSFELLDISGDAGIRAYGKNLKELFSNAGLGMCSLITDTAAINESEQVEVTVEADSLGGLLVAFLNELVFRFDTHGFIARSIRVDSFLAPDNTTDEHGFSIRATLSGEAFDPDRHERRLLIKAATYHKLRIEQRTDRWEADIIFDI